MDIAVSILIGGSLLVIAAGIISGAVVITGTVHIAIIYKTSLKKALHDPYRTWYGVADTFIIFALGWLSFIIGATAMMAISS